jgi:hypothetical protein
MSSRAAGPAAIWTLKISGYGWHATLEIESSATLHELHLAIQRAVQFDNDHLYTFYAARTERARDRIDYEDSLDTITLKRLFPLPDKKKLFYWFDFGDDWKFTIARTRLAPKAPEAGVTYPRVITMSGEPPEQYPEY